MTMAKFETRTNTSRARTILVGSVGDTWRLGDGFRDQQFDASGDAHKGDDDAGVATEQTEAQHVHDAFFIGMQFYLLLLFYFVRIAGIEIEKDDRDKQGDYAALGPENTVFAMVRDAYPTKMFLSNMTK